jgi:hypothetical protein
VRTENELNSNGKITNPENSGTDGPGKAETSFKEIVWAMLHPLKLPVNTNAVLG